LRAAEEAHAHDPERAELIARVRRFKAGWYELAEALTEQRSSESFKRWGYSSFDDYCKRELHLKPDTVAKLTGSYGFLRARAPEVLARDGRDAPIPTYQSVDFLRRAEEESEAPEETLGEIRRMVLDEGTPLPRLSRQYRRVVFPTDENDSPEKRNGSLRKAIERLVELVAIAKSEGDVSVQLAAEVEEPLARLAAHLG
jgi:hypothetical protein